MVFSEVYVSKKMGDLDYDLFSFSLSLFAKLLLSKQICFLN